MPGLLAGAVLVGASLGGGVAAGTGPSDACLSDPYSAECMAERARDEVGRHPKEVIDGGKMAYEGLRARGVADDGVRLAKPLVVGGAAGAGAAGVAVVKHQKKKQQAS
jgi:hypothetical protein